MGEQPLFSCKAHVFQLEPELKKSWIALSTAAVNVQVFHDSIKNIYRIVSVEGSKALINSIVTPKMTFTKTSQKFGQWIDFKLNLVYGLGFANDVELNKFVDKFKEIKELTRNTPSSSSSSTTNTLLRAHERSNSCEITNNRNNNNNSNVTAADSTTGTAHDLSNSVANDIQMKYENERLKLALAQNSTTTRKIEEELLALKTSNTRLVAALQESHTNIEEWKKQLQYYKDECNRLRNSTTNIGGSRNGQNNLMIDNDIDDEVSSSTNSLNNNNNQQMKEASEANTKKIKQEILKLTDSFDKKFKELHEIREQIRQLALEL